MTGLHIDGEPVGGSRLDAAVRAVRDGAGGWSADTRAPLVLASEDPLVVVAAMLAAEQTARGLVFDGEASAAGPVITAGSAGNPVTTMVSGRPRVDQPAGLGAVFRTSGSSGQPKRVALPMTALEYQGRATAEHLGITADDRLLLPLPLSHAYGFSVLKIWRATGATLFIETRFRLRSIVTRILCDGITAMDGVPSSYRLLAAAGARDPEVRAAVAAPRIRGCGGDVLTPVLAAHYADRLGAPLHDGYGLSEAGPNVALSAPHLLRAGTVGRPLAGTTVRIAAPDNEIQVSGPGLMLGYLDQDSGTLSRDAFTADGWLRTGDTGELSDDGFLTVAGRTKEILVVHGETIAPTVLEEVIRQVAGVADAAVVGVRGGRNGDVIHAFLVADERSQIQVLAAVRTACREALPAQMRPSRFHLVPALPRTRTGKHDRTTLRSWAGPARAATRRAP